MPNPASTHLSIRELELIVHLGCEKKEREQPQIVFLHFDLYFATPLRACETDDLNDTICYASLIQSIRDHLALKEYNLVEHLAADIYQVIKNQLEESIRVVVQLTKYPDIPGLKSGVCFHYGNPE